MAFVILACGGMAGLDNDPENIDATRISFESMTDPGYYLTQAAFDFFSVAPRRDQIGRLIRA